MFNSPYIRINKFHRFYLPTYFHHTCVSFFFYQFTVHRQHDGIFRLEARVLCAGKLLSPLCPVYKVADRIDAVIFPILPGSTNLLSGHSIFKISRTNSNDLLSICSSFADTGFSHLKLSVFNGASGNTPSAPSPCFYNSLPDLNSTRHSF